jgi:hypothetical protein
MKRAKKHFLWSGAALIFFIFLFLLYHLYTRYSGIDSISEPVDAKILSTDTITRNWSVLSSGRKGKVIYARPPKLFVMDLSSGSEKAVPGVTVAGAPGRRHRGKSPRPSWSPDGSRFVYRYDGHVYVCDDKGNKQIISNLEMDCSDETRWSWFRQYRSDSSKVEFIDWVAGPSKNKNVILVRISDPTIVNYAYNGGDVDKHCEITGSGGFVVYDNGSDIYVTRFGSSDRGIKISRGQSCRPCAAPDHRAAWLPVPHTRYHLYNAQNGQFITDLDAPPNEELYRLNWSNLPDFAVHMFGSRGSTRIHIRKISSGEYVFIGHGWDPDLWVGD